MFTTLPLGLTSTPFVFTIVRITCFLKECLETSKCFETGKNSLTNAGFTVNNEKSVLHSSKTLTY